MQERLKTTLMIDVDIEGKTVAIVNPFDNFSSNHSNLFGNVPVTRISPSSNMLALFY